MCAGYFIFQVLSVTCGLEPGAQDQFWKHSKFMISPSHGMRNFWFNSNKIQHTGTYLNIYYMPQVSSELISLLDFKWLFSDQGRESFALSL